MAVQRNYMFPKGSCLGSWWIRPWKFNESIWFHKDPAWIHHGSDVADFTKQHVFTWILPGCTVDPTLKVERNHMFSRRSCLGPLWTRRCRFHEPTCFHKDPARIHGGSNFECSTNPPVFTRNLPGTTMDLPRNRLAK